MKNLLSLIVISLILAGCASQQLQKEWQARGYTESDKALIMPHFDQYTRQLAAAKTASGNVFMAASQNSGVEQNLQNVFCNCVKKLGDKCRKPSAEVGETDKQLWAKSNGAEMALKAQHNGNLVASVGDAGTVDPDQCSK